MIYNSAAVTPDIPSIRTLVNEFSILGPAASPEFVTVAINFVDAGLEDPSSAGERVKRTVQGVLPKIGPVLGPRIARMRYDKFIGQDKEAKGKCIGKRSSWRESQTQAPGIQLSLR